MKIRFATAADLDAIVALERSIENAPHWPRSSYAEILLPAASAVARALLLAEDQAAQIVGLAVIALREHDPEQAGELESVAVAPSARRAGIGRALMNAVLDWLRLQAAAEVELEVRQSSAAAIALYRSLGFKEVGRRRNYYRDPQEDAVLMRLTLRNAE